MYRMLRSAQIDSSDGAAVKAWNEEYTNYMRAAAPEGVTVSCWRETYGAYGVIYWSFDAPTLAELDDFLADLSTQEGLRDILKRGSSLYLSGKTKDTLLAEVC